MCEKLNLSDFDILGVIMLQDVNGIEKYVTPVIEKGKKVGYLSRSREYYNVKTMTELLSSREELKTKLTTKLSKRNFVILDRYKEGPNEVTNPISKWIIKNVVESVNKIQDSPNNSEISK